MREALDRVQRKIFMRRISEDDNAAAVYSRPTPASVERDSGQCALRAIELIFFPLGLLSLQSHCACENIQGLHIRKNSY
jgi:hypothetical protein